MHSGYVRLLAIGGLVAAASASSDGIAQPAVGLKKESSLPKVDLMAPYKPTCPGSYATRPPGSNTVLTTLGPFTLTIDALGSEDRCLGKKTPSCTEGTLAVDSSGHADACKTSQSSKPPTCGQGYSLKAAPGADECRAQGDFACPPGHKAENRAGADLCLPVGGCAAGSALAADRSGSDDKCVISTAYSCPTGFHPLVDPRDNSNTHIPPDLRATLMADVCERNAASTRTGVLCGGGKIGYHRSGTDFCFSPTAPAADPSCPTGLILFREAGRDVCAPAAYGVKVSP